MIALPPSFSWSRESFWNEEFSVNGLTIKAKSPNKDAFPCRPSKISSYFWGKSLCNRLRGALRWKSLSSRFPRYTGYSEVKSLIGQGTVADLEALAHEAEDIVAQIYGNFDQDSSDTSFTYSSSSPSQIPSSLTSSSGPGVVQLRLSPELERWRQDQYAAGNVIPPKGFGLDQASDETLHILGATEWPEALKTNNALFGCGIASLFIGGADPSTVFSNYVTDMAFYYEHGYNEIFPSLEPLVERGLDDKHALRTLGGRERRQAVRIGRRYIQGKIALEKEHKAHLTNVSARLSRREAQIVSLSESSLLGMAGEVIALGYDPAAVMNDLVWCSPGTDVVDVGCDLRNSEVLNSFLNVSDITDTGIVTEDVLRKVYDAYAAAGARMLTQRWHEPIARMCAALYTWHIQNDRHMFFRRALLGWRKACKTPALPQREADFDEVFNKMYFLTGFSRPLDPRSSCNGEETCNHVRHFLHCHRKEPLLQELWILLVLEPLDYVEKGQVDEERERHLAEASRVAMAKLFSKGLVLEMVWLVAHANHHAWQVNYLFEAAMFGSILDTGSLAGKLDRKEN